MDDVKDILYPALGVAVGVLLAGALMHKDGGRKLPVVGAIFEFAHGGFDS